MYKRNVCSFDKLYICVIYKLYTDKIITDIEK